MIVHSPSHDTYIKNSLTYIYMRLKKGVINECIVHTRSNPTLFFYLLFYCDSVFD